MHHKLGLVSLALQQAHKSVRRSQALHQMREHAVQNFLDGQRLRAGGRQQSKPPQFLVQLDRSRARALQHHDHHGDSQRHAQQMVKRHSQQKVGMLRPQRTVQSVDAGQ